MEELLQGRVRQLTTNQLDELSEALLDFGALEDLLVWLEAHPVEEGDKK